MTAFPQLTGPCSFLKKIRLALHDLLSMNTRWPLNNYLLFFLLMKYLLFSLKIFLLAGGNGNLYSPIALCLPLKKRDHRKCFEKSKRFHKCTVCYQNHKCQSLACRPPTVAKSPWTQSRTRSAEKHSICPALHSQPRTPGFFIWSSAFLTIHFRGGFTGVIFCPAQFYSVSLTFYVVVSTVLCPKPHL